MIVEKNPNNFLLRNVWMLGFNGPCMPRVREVWPRMSAPIEWDLFLWLLGPGVKS